VVLRPTPQNTKRAVRFYVDRLNFSSWISLSRMDVFPGYFLNRDGLYQVGQNNGVPFGRAGLRGRLAWSPNSFC